jgi:hypothetical protein
MEMFRASTIDHKIEKVQIVKKTKHFVWLPGDRRNAVNSDWQWYRPTWKEAHNCLVDYYNLHIAKREAEINFYNKKIEKIMELKEK